MEMADSGSWIEVSGGGQATAARFLRGIGFGINEITFDEREQLNILLDIIERDLAM